MEEKMKKIIIFVLIMAIFLSCIPVSADTPVNITAPAAILIDAKSGKVLYEKNADEKHYPASTTKIMTGILAMERGNFDEIVTVGTNPPLIKKGSSQIYLVPGEQLTMNDLIYALMLESANDAAIAIAEHISGTVEEFTKLMNAKAKEVGANNTNFVNPNGLHDNNHYTTARDLALIAKYAMNNQKFRDVVSQVKYTIPKTNKQDERNYITNSNRLLWTLNDKYRYEHAIGIKTGYTTEAKNCLVGGAKKDDVELISVVLAADGTQVYTDTIALFNYGFENFENVELLRKDQIAATAPVANSDEKINLVAAESYSLLLSESEKIRLTTDIKIKDKIMAPVAKGDVLGEMYIYLDGKEIKKIDLLSSVDLNPPQKKAGWWWLWVIILFLLYRTVVTIRKTRKRRAARTVKYISR